MNFSNEDTASRSDIFYLHSPGSLGASGICIIQSSAITFLSNRSLVCLTSSQYQEVRNYCHAWGESFAAEIVKVRLVINTNIFLAALTVPVSQPRPLGDRISQLIQHKLHCSLHTHCSIPHKTEWIVFVQQSKAFRPAQIVSVSEKFFGVILPWTFYLF